MRSLRCIKLIVLCLAAVLAAVDMEPAVANRPVTAAGFAGSSRADGRWVFLKIGKPLRKFSDAAACEKLVADLDTLQARGFNALELNCYWHHFDTDGDGTIDVSLDPLGRLIDAIHAKGMFPCLSVETYGVGGGKIPDPFWKRHPDAIAINAEGEQVRDLEYGFKTAVPSIFHADYLQASRAFIRSLVAGLPHQKILFYETTVEPQFMGHQDIDYSGHAKQAYAAWLMRQGLEGPAWPDAFPVPGAFRMDPVWLRFRAESLADWVNGDAAAFRDIAGTDAYIAVDYLETGNATMPRRNGDSVLFLEALTCADIIQVNWHWRTDLKGPNECAYRTVWDVKERLGRPVVVVESELFTTRRSDIHKLPPQARALGQGIPEHGRHVGRVVIRSVERHVLADRPRPPKPLMAAVDDHWPQWQQEITTRPALPSPPPRPRNAPPR